MNIKENSKYFIYLFNLQESGRVNMFEAGAFLQSEMGLDKGKAREILLYWMENYESVAKELSVEIICYHSNMIKKVYKVTAVDLRSVCSLYPQFQKNEFLRNWVVQYSTVNWVTAIGDTKLFAFDDLHPAKVFSRQISLKYGVKMQIWEADAVGVTSHKRVLRVTKNFISRVKRFWEGKLPWNFRGLKILNCGGHVGYLLCDKIILRKLVDIYR